MLGGWGGGSQSMSTAVHITWHGAQINFGDLLIFNLCSCLSLLIFLVQSPIFFTFQEPRNRTKLSISPAYVQCRLSLFFQFVSWSFLQLCIKLLLKENYIHVLEFERVTRTVKNQYTVYAAVTISISPPPPPAIYSFPSLSLYFLCGGKALPMLASKDFGSAASSWSAAFAITQLCNCRLPYV